MGVFLHGLRARVTLVLVVGSFTLTRHKPHAPVWPNQTGAYRIIALPKGKRIQGLHMPSNKRLDLLDIRIHHLKALRQGFDVFQPRRARWVAVQRFADGGFELGWQGGFQADQRHAGFALFQAHFQAVGGVTRKYYSLILSWAAYFLASKVGIFKAIFNNAQHLSLVFWAFTKLCQQLRSINITPTDL